MDNKSALQGAAFGDACSADSNFNQAVLNSLRFGGQWEIVCIGPDGKEKWRDTIENLVVNTGLDEILEQFFNGSTYTASHFVLLTDGTPTVAAGDTMASHAGWTEPTLYSEANRPAYNPAAASGQSIDNSASKASFSVNASGTVGGCGLSTNNTKGGTTGILISAGAFTQGDKAVDDGDTINVQITYNGSSS